MSVRTAPLLMTLFGLTVGQRPFTVNVTRENHQAVEHSNTTLTWLFPVSTDTPSASLHIHIRSVNPLRTVFLYDSPSEAEPYQDEDYRGRAWCDPELARKGRIECLLTDLRLSDTGSYQCVVAVNRDSSHKACHLSVTAASIQAVTEPSKPAGQGRIGLYAAFDY
ncbi:butyrophilin subfamily 1 member A1-like isoform X2 [Acanthopagrus latus]|uniref:butyrophilin subfamily 1 member A1-like isoform X2 n=1 Tax=Acanthopagrus latus TaxID=8177 RepID=UPI00187CB488|nr:butyrophilin subfamily 1 member A1-like isoform X2 [Acanthopagrus latus]